MLALLTGGKFNMPQRGGFGSGAGGFGGRGMGMGVVLVETVWLCHMEVDMTAGLVDVVWVALAVVVCQWESEE
jgi:hypothetical protein